MHALCSSLFAPAARWSPHVLGPVAANNSGSGRGGIRLESAIGPFGTAHCHSSLLLKVVNCDKGASSDEESAPVPPGFLYVMSNATMSLNDVPILKIGFSTNPEHQAGGDMEKRVGDGRNLENLRYRLAFRGEADHRGTAP